MTASFADVSRPLNELTEFRLWTISNTDVDRFNEVVATMGIGKVDARCFLFVTLGERCIVRRQLRTSTTNILGEDYEVSRITVNYFSSSPFNVLFAPQLEVVELVDAWHHTVILPSIVVDTSITTKHNPLFNPMDYQFTIHYRFYKRPHSRAVDFNPDHVRLIRTHDCAPWLIIELLCDLIRSQVCIVLIGVDSAKGYQS